MVQVSSLLPELQLRLTYLRLALHQDELSDVRRRAAAPFFDALTLSPAMLATPHSESTRRLVLSMIADLYGVDRECLTDPYADPQRDTRITEQLTEVRQYPHRAHLFHPASTRTTIPLVAEQVEIVTSLGRAAIKRLYWRIAAFTLPALALLPMLLWALLSSPELNSQMKGVGAFIICAVFGYSIYQEARAIRALIRTLDLDPDTFESTYHHNIRVHVAEHLSDYLSQTDLCYDELYAVLRNRSPISLGLLGRLSAGQSRKQKHLLERAAGRFLP